MQASSMKSGFVLPGVVKSLKGSSLIANDVTHHFFVILSSSKTSISSREYLLLMDSQVIQDNTIFICTRVLFTLLLLYYNPKGQIFARKKKALNGVECSSMKTLHTVLKESQVEFNLLSFQEVQLKCHCRNILSDMCVREKATDEASTLASVASSFLTAVQSQTA